MKNFLLLVVLGACGGEDGPPYATPDRVPCEEQSSGSTADAVTWRNASSKTACNGLGIAVVGATDWPSLQILCCSTLTGTSGWCRTDQISATDARECCEPSAYTGLCFTVSSR